MIAIDSSVLIDLLGEDARAEAAEDCLRTALARGPVVVSLGLEASGADFGGWVCCLLRAPATIWSRL